jgi:hypothetical protein
LKGRNVRKELLIFAGGVVVGVGAMALWTILSTNTSEPDVVSNITPVERPPVKRSSELPPSPAPVKTPSPRVTTSQSANPIEVATPVPQNTAVAPTPAPPIAVPYLDARLQTALRTYRTTSDKIDRSALVDEVGKLTDAAVPKPQVAVALGTMLQEENSVDVKTDILDELGNLDDPSAFDQIVQGLSRSQPQEVRLEAIDALDMLGDQRAIPVLKQLLNDHDADIREAAGDAIDSLADY